MKKKALRKEIIKKRAMLSDKEIIDKSHSILDRLLNIPEFINSDCVLVYIDYNHEVSTRAIINYCIENNKSIYAPKVIGDYMEFIRFEDYNSLMKSSMGILEPTGDDIYLSGDSKDIAIIPGVVFDTDCNRIGYGGGFYDKYLEVHPWLVKVAVAFELQIIDSIESEEFDIKPDIIVTDRRIIK